MAVGVYPTAINPVTGALFYPSAVASNSTSPADHNYLTWTYDPAVSLAGTTVPAGGVLHLIKLKLDQAALVSNIIINLTSAGTTLTSGQNFALLYSSGGTLLGSTATQHTAWQSGGVKTMALVTPVTVPAGYVYGGFYTVGSVLPTISRGQVTTANGGNAGLSAPNLRHATADTGLTDTPPATFGAQTAGATAWWMALS